MSDHPEIIEPIRKMLENERALAFNVSLGTVYRMCKDGELMTVRTPGSIRICRDMSFVLLGLDR